MRFFRRGSQPEEEQAPDLADAPAPDPVVEPDVDPSLAPETDAGAEAAEDLA